MILAESDLILLRRIPGSLRRGDSFSEQKSFSDLGCIFRREAPGRVEGSGQSPTYDHFSIFPPFGSSVHHRDSANSNSVKKTPSSPLGPEDAIVHAVNS
jgi:hypothetical protein